MGDVFRDLVLEIAVVVYSTSVQSSVVTVITNLPIFLRVIKGLHANVASRLFLMLSLQHLCQENHGLLWIQALQPLSLSFYMIYKPFYTVFFSISLQRIWNVYLLYTQNLDGTCLLTRPLPFFSMGSRMLSKSAYMMNGTSNCLSPLWY